MWNKAKQLQNSGPSTVPIWQFSHIHILNKKKSRQNQQFKTTFPRFFFFGGGGGGGGWGINVFTQKPRKPVVSQDYVSLMQNLVMHFSCWAQHIDSIETCQYPTVNSQILIFYDTAVDFVT